MNTIEGNKLIGEFCGWVEQDGLMCLQIDGAWWRIDLEDFKYHSSWDWLMPPYKKFNDMVVAEEIKHDMESSALHDALEVNILKVNITEAHKCLSQLIQWYNNQTPTNKNNKV